MRVLLIDNHDSFTYNLAHDIAVVSGAWPDVVLNDATLDSDVNTWLDGYDAVVVSPGPGTPVNPADLGHSRAAVEQGDVPVLGVCLGHQAIGHAHGARVGRAPRPVHGEVADVLHHGTGLFEGLPNPLRMVRYHSLVVTDLPPHLVADAHLDDGLVMALHHRSRPLWGIQTHPESICSEHGRALIGNFLELARQWNDTRRVRLDGSVRDESWGGFDFSAFAEGAGRRVVPGPDSRVRHVLAERLPWRGDTSALFDALFRGHDHAWWLDSALSAENGTKGGGRFSYLGSAAGPLARVATCDEGATEVVVRDASGGQRQPGTMFDLVQRDLASVHVTVENTAGEQVEAPMDFRLGWAGYLGYELGLRELLGAPFDATTSGLAAASSSETPDAVLVFADRAVAVDHRDGAAWALALLPEDESDAAATTAAQQREWVRETAETLGQLGRLPELGQLGQLDELAEPASTNVSRAATESTPPQVESLELRHDHDTYLALVDACREHIAAGESYELCLTNQITVHAQTDPWQLYRRLRTTSPRPFAAYLAFDGAQVLSASPERFVRVGGGEVEAKPIKGTRPRGSTPEEDEALAAELASDPKELAENLMIVDLLRNDLGRVARTGSVHVPMLFDVETYEGVHQLVSTIRARLAKGWTSVDAVREAFPGGSMTGAPKERSVSILRDLEAGPRGVYSGAIGYFSLSGEADWSIVIRSIIWHPDHLTYGIGGAVTARSTPEAEWHETLVKARTLGTALGIDLDEHFTPGSA
ncbi:MAG: aminodeoxychorismate synthase component I [Dermatophilus congolensis]|nr:aminodeoxychorismate synthase component I [Dermatophilus congolensis]